MVGNNGQNFTFLSSAHFTYFRSKQLMVLNPYLGPLRGGTEVVVEVAESARAQR